MHERTNYITDERIALQLGVSEKLLEKPRRIQDLESQRTRKAATLEECLEVMTNRYHEKNDPLEKAKNIRQKKTDVLRRTPKAAQRREAIPAAMKRQIDVRDQAQCIHIDENGQRCPNRRWLEVHHLKPVGFGGENSVQNLVTLCFAHHRMQHAYYSRFAVPHQARQVFSKNPESGRLQLQGG